MWTSHMGLSVFTSASRSWRTVGYDGSALHARACSYDSHTEGVVTVRAQGVSVGVVVTHILVRKLT